MKRRAGAWLIVILGMVICRGMFLDNVIYNVDEAEYAVAADMLKSGGLPGVDLLGSTKPPGIAGLYLLLFELFGRSMTVIHLAQLILMIGLGLIVIEVAIRVWGESAAIPAAVLFWMSANSFSLPSEMLALNVEIPGTLLAMSAILAALRAKRSSHWIISGLLIGLAVTFRQSLLVFLLPIAAIFWHQTERRAKTVLYIIAGFAIPWVVIIVLYAAHNGLGWAIDSWIRYPAVYASDVGWAGFFTAMFLNLWEYLQQSWIPLGLAAMGMSLLFRKTVKFDKVLLWSLVAASFLALCSGSRFFGHYFVQIFPAIALLGVPAWLWLQGKSKLSMRILIGIVGIGTVIAFMHFPLWRYWDSAATRSGIPEASLTSYRLEYEAAKLARESTSAEQTIAVWGYCPQIYYLAERAPAVRDYLCHYVTGFSTGSFDPVVSKPFRESGHPQAREMFVDDLERNKPQYIFDLASVQDYEYTFTNLPLEDFPEIDQYIVKHYDEVQPIGWIRVYKLKSNLN
jgi:4-amino-4-deoxy-L-arabinose transferase-like glycosyltransferase